jgi:hypothetical protein
MRRWVCALAMLSALGSSARAGADTSSSKAVAEALFRDGTQLLAGGDVEAACPKFAESMKVDAALGTLLYLAACHEKQGRTASAWSEFSSARAWAERTEQHDREAFAQKHMTALEARLSDIVITAPQIPGLALKLDDGALTAASLDTALPVDPGDHTIEAAAPDRQSWKTTVNVPPEPGRFLVQIPDLLPLPPAPPPPPPPVNPAPAPIEVPPPVAPAPGPSSGARVAMWTALGFTAAGVGVGAWFGVLTFQERDAARTACPRNSCEPGGLDHISLAKNDAVVSTVAFSVAGAAAVVSGYFLFKRYDRARRALAGPITIAVAPAFAPGTAGLALGGEFE